uniref:Uncharacterized protein n=1 Tax=Arundo donax TaxID=35708 RepID=A0A0A9AXR9_ARUDO
MTVGCRLDG